MSRTKRVLNYLLLVTIIYISFHFAIFGLGLFLQSEFPFAVVEGVSMEPNFYDGDLLIVKGVDDKRDINPQDVIIFREPTGRDRLIVHRVVERIVSDTKVEFVTKGDNNTPRDPWRVREIDIIGVVIARVPAVGSVVMAIQSPVGKMFTAIIAIIVIGANVFYDEDGGRVLGKVLL